MSGGWWGLVAAVVLGLIIKECGELSPWLAQKLVRWAARVRYPTRVEELSALIAERPGKLFKLVTAAGFVCAALTYRVTHRKTVPVHSATSRFWIGLGSALVAGVLLAGELLLAIVITYVMPSLHLFFNTMGSNGILIGMGSIAAFGTAAELLVSTRLPAGWATAVVSFALFLIATIVLGSVPGVGEFLSMGGMAVAAGVSAACAIRLGNRLRFPVMTASSTMLGGGLLTFGAIWTASTSALRNVDALVMLSSLGFGFGFSAGVGVLLWQVLCGKRLSQSSSERVSRAAT